MKKRFIEWDLPLADISEESAREKSIRHGHPSTVHIWWARRPLSSSRATNFAALIDLPKNSEEQKKIFNLIRKITPWEAVKDGNNNDVLKARELIENQWRDIPPKVLDPFSGGGSIPLEAYRLGCETYANDYNPLAILIEKATLEWPQKFGIKIPHPDKPPGIDGTSQKINFLSYMVNKWGQAIIKSAKKEIGSFYPNDEDGKVPVGYIWARTIPCQNPNCNIDIPLIKQFWLSNKTDKKIAYKPIIDNKNCKINFTLIEDNFDGFNPKDGTISRGNVSCPLCKQVTKVKQVRKLAQDGKMGERLIAVVLYKPGEAGKKYRIASNKDFEIFKETLDFLNEKMQKLDCFDNPIPDEEIPLMSGVFNVPLYGMNNWGDLFNNRQKLSLLTLCDLIRSSYKDIINDCNELKIEKYGLNKDDAAKAIMGYLGLIFGRLTDKNSRLVQWQNTGEKIGHVFGRQALPMTWDYVELNIFSGVNGDWLSNLNWILRYIENGSWETNTNSFISNYSATNLPFSNDFFDAIFTDPPYYNNVPYADLSDYFYVWLKRCLSEVFSDIFSTPLSPKTHEICEMKGWDAKRYYDKDKEFFEKNLSKSFQEIYRVLKQDGIATIVYAHKTTSGWETMLNSLVNSGLVVTASWPIHTEMKTRLRAAASAALSSSIYMVCRKTKREKVGFYSEIKPKIKQRIEEKLQQFWNDGIAGGDFFISAIGPGMEIFSKYEKIEKFSGEQVTTSELLDYIRTVSTDFIVNKLLKNTGTAKIDNESEFYLAFRWTYLENSVEYDDARKLANASGINLEKLWEIDGFVKKSGSNISVLGPKERDNVNKINNMVDVMHKSVLLWEKGDRENLKKLLAETGYGKDPAFKQFCQAVAESLINGNKEKQLLEGFLIGIDAYTRGKVKAPKDQTDLKQFGGS